MKLSSNTIPPLFCRSCLHRRSPMHIERATHSAEHRQGSAWCWCVLGEDRQRLCFTQAGKHLLFFRTIQKAVKPHQVNHGPPKAACTNMSGPSLDGCTECRQESTQSSGCCIGSVLEREAVQQHHSSIVLPKLPAQDSTNAYCVVSIVKKLWQAVNLLCSLDCVGSRWELGGRRSPGGGWGGGG